MCKNAPCKPVWPLKMTEPPPAPDASFARLELDEPDEPTNFRMCPWLPMSGSAQFGRGALRTILGAIRDQSNSPISWFAENDWGDVGMTDHEVTKMEKLRLSIVRRSPIISIYKKDETKPQMVPIHGAVNEEVLVSGEDVHYERLHVTDHLRPHNHVVDEFVGIIGHHLDISPWYHFHCHAGDGRTTTFMVLYDMLVNAATIGCCEILERNCQLSNYDLIEPLPEPYTKFSEERRDFVMTFYEYARQEPLRTGMRWSDWSPSV